MAIKDTGMDVYESAMAPMRQNIQGIFAHQAKERAAREALAAEERANARKIATEERADARTLATEQRRIGQAEDLALEMAIAEANRYGLTTEGKNSAQLNQDIAAHVEKLGPQGRLMSNLDVIREKKLLSEEEIGQLTRGEMKKAEMEGMEVRFKPAIDTWRKSQASEEARKTPGWHRKFDGARARYTELAGELSELKGEEIRERADGIIANYEAGNQMAMTQERIASTLTLAQPGMEEVFHKYKVLTESWMENPGEVIVGNLPVHDPDGPNGPMLPMNMWHQDFSTEDRKELLAAWGQASEQAFAAAKTDAEIKYWTATLKLNKNASVQQSIDARAKEIRDEMKGITTVFPSMNRYNVMTGEFTKPLFRSVQEKEEVKDDDPIAEIKAARAARESREATTSPSDYSVSIENGRMVVSRNPDPMVSAVGPAPAINQRGPDDAEGRRADYEILKDQGYNPENMQYYSREKFEDEKAAIAAGVARPSAYAQEVTDAKAARTAEEIELEGYPADVQASGYYHREGTPGYPALQPRTERPVSDPIQELQKEAAQEALSQMREALYGNFAQPGDYDPRLPGAIEAIRGQLGQVPPLGREPESEKIRRNMDIQGQLGNLMPRTPANPDEYPALMERTSPPSRKLKAGNNWWVRGGNPEPAQMSGDVSRRAYHR